MSDKQNSTPWVCPWGICNQEQAQECRAEMRVRKGCGGMFPADMTPEAAAQSIKRPDTPNTLPANGGVSDADIKAAVELCIMWPNPANSTREIVKRTLEFAQSRPPSIQSAGVVDKDALHIKVMYLDDDTPPFIFWCHGRMGGSVLGDIEEEMAERPEDIFDKGFGDYEFKVTRDPGQYGEYGRCEIAPYWDFTDISYTPHIEGAPAWIAPPPAGGGKEALSDAERPNNAVLVPADGVRGMANEYQAWLDFYHAGNGSFDDFLCRNNQGEPS